MFIFVLELLVLGFHILDLGFENLFYVFDHGIFYYKNNLWRYNIRLNFSEYFFRKYGNIKMSW